MVRLRSRDSEQESLGKCDHCKEEDVELFDAGHVHLCKECFESDMGRKTRERDKL